PTVTTRVAPLASENELGLGVSHGSWEDSATHSTLMVPNVLLTFCTVIVYVNGPASGGFVVGL
ncbi:MAG TPA: hypothetical protein VJ755_01670, partial [Gemmatimonadales bacterium]|nr:hypothetical protein [Gemmatimonadales bacterium]